MKSIVPLSVLLSAFSLVGALGCQHTMRVETTPPGAAVLLDGTEVGKSPVDVQVDPGAYDSEVQILVRKGDRERSVPVKRSEIDWQTLGASAALDGGVCVACSGLSLIGGLFVPPLLAGVCVFPVATASALPLQYLMAGNRVPSRVHIDLESGAVERTAAHDNGTTTPDERAPVADALAVAY